MNRELWNQSKYFLILRRTGRRQREGLPDIISISDDKITELLDTPLQTFGDGQTDRQSLLTRTIGRTLLTLQHTKLPPTAQQLISFYDTNPRIFAGGIELYREWVKATDNHNIIRYLRVFSGGLYLIVTPHLNRIEVCMAKWLFPFRYNPYPETTLLIYQLLQREENNTPDTPEFCFFQRLLSLLDTPEEKHRLRDFKSRLVLYYGNLYYSILQSLIAFLDSPDDNQDRIRLQIPNITSDDDLFREMISIRPIANGPLFDPPLVEPPLFDPQHNQGRKNKSKNKNRKRMASKNKNRKKHIRYNMS